MEILIPDFDFDLRLLNIDLELSALDSHLYLLEEHIRKTKASEHTKLQKEIDEHKLTPDDPDWQINRGEFFYFVDYLLPRFFRSPFLVSLYAVYESAVTEIAKLMQEKNGIATFINDHKLKGDFLNKAKNYYDHVIGFPLCTNKLEWDRIKMLSDLRNAIAHANGRIEMLKPRIEKKITDWEKQKIGISSMNGFVVIEEGFLRDTLGLVSASLSDLVERYRKWEDKQTSSSK